MVKNDELLMIPINSVIKKAEGEIGYVEKNSSLGLDGKTSNPGHNNYTKYWRDVYPKFQGQYWCACFVTWCFDKVFGKDTTAILLGHYPFVYCPTLAAMTTNHVPHIGDVVLFWRYGRFAHTGIVSWTDGKIVETIEGNTSGGDGVVPNGGMVCRKWYNIKDLEGSRFFRPDWVKVAPRVGDRIKIIRDMGIRKTPKKGSGYVAFSDLKNPKIIAKCRKSKKGNSILKTNKVVAIREVKRVDGGDVFVRIPIGDGWVNIGQIDECIAVVYRRKK